MIFCHLLSHPNNDFFSIKLHHGGAFVNGYYKGGDVHFFYHCDVDEMSMLKLKDKCEQLG